MEHKKVSIVRAMVEDVQTSGGYQTLDVMVTDALGYFFTIRYVYPTSDLGRAVYYKLREAKAIESYVEGTLDRLHSIHIGMGMFRVIEPSEVNSTWQETYSQFFGVTEEGEPVGDSRFTQAEVNLLHSAIEKAKTEIRNTFQPDSEQWATIVRRLDNLERNAAATTKLDWRRWLVTGVVGIATDLGLGLSGAQALIDIFKSVLSDIVHAELGRGNRKPTQLP